jgi:pimeloyl-ACP methyl ester carboxylesterase
MRLLWPQLLTVDLFRTVPELGVPVFFMAGRYDREAPSEIAERYFQSIRTPAKEQIWFDRSAHMPNSEQRDLFNKVTVAKVLPIAADQF